ncbi:uncharacterized protein DMENIID0001_146790 [Sergentomyia squamirostris]
MPHKLWWGLHFTFVGHRPVARQTSLSSQSRLPVYQFVFVSTSGRRRFTASVVAIFFFVTIAFAQIPPHRAVLNIEQEENLLPDYLRNPFLRTPRVAAALAVSSWLGHGEQPVFEREADKIPRHQIYSVLTHAGFIPRRLYK